MFKIHEAIEGVLMKGPIEIEHKINLRHIND